LWVKWHVHYRLLVGSVVIDAELGRENHNSISATAIGESRSYYILGRG
jgi:hypothetical protein